MSSSRREVDSVGLPDRAIHVVERLLDGELVLYDPKRQRVHALNSTAAFVWRACDGRSSLADIAESLARRYPDDRQAILEDVPQIIARFGAEGLLKP